MSSGERRYYVQAVAGWFEVWDRLAAVCIVTDIGTKREAECEASKLNCNNKFPSQQDKLQQEMEGSESAESSRIQEALQGITPKAPEDIPEWPTHAHSGFE